MSGKHPKALAVIAAALALVFTPPRQVTPSAWAAENLIVADGPRAGFKWDMRLTPQLVPILDALKPGSPWNQVVLRKSSQVGATGLGIAWLGSIVCNTPAKTMVIFPTISAVQDYAREKLQPTISATPALRARVREQTSRSSRGSTALNKMFTGGSIILTGANSTVDLRSKTVKFQHRDEIDDWPVDLEGQGDPEEMADARLISFHASGDYMVFKSSTPTIKGRSRIDAAFEKGDRRFWHVACPHCGVTQKLVFGNGTGAGLRFNREAPHNAHYVCVSGCVIEHHDKSAMIDGGHFVAENPDGLYPSFHVDALTSKLTTWDKIAEKFVAAKDDPTKLKAFVNLWLGESWEERGDAPEWKHLMVRREAFPRGVMPPGALVLTLAVDVQGNGLFFEVVGWGADKQSWSIDAGFLAGDTAESDGPVWKSLTELSERRYADAYGGSWPVDLIGVDAGFNSKAVKAWTRGRPKTMALKGMPGWYLPPVGTPTRVDVTFQGKKRKKGAMLWPVGTWPLKAELYALLRKEAPIDGSEAYPGGFIHLGEHNDERYCRQLVAETLKDREAKGRMVKEWVATGDNHFHDCRIYGLALFDHMGGNRWTSDQWKLLAQQRGVKPEQQKELFTVEPAKAVVTMAQPAVAGRRIRSKGIA